MRKRFAIAAAVTAAAAFGGCANDPGAQAVIEVQVAVEPHAGPDIIIAADGDVWLPASDTFGGTEVPYDEAQHALVRVDPERGEVEAVVPLPHPMTAVAVGEGGVWATGTDYGPDDPAPRGSLVKVDAEANEVVLSVDLGAGSPSDVAVGFGSVWVTDSALDLVYRVDPATGGFQAEISVDGGPTSLAVTDDDVWVAKPGSGQVRPIEPRTNAPGDAVGVGPRPEILAAGGAGLYAGDYTSRAISRIDLDGGGVADTIDLKSAPSRIDVGDDIVVVSEVEERSLSVVRAGKRRVVLTDRLIVGVALAEDGRTVWAADPEDGGVLRIRLPAA